MHEEIKNQQTEVRECLLSLDAETFVFQSASQKYKHYNILNNNFAFATHIEGGM